MYQRYQVAPQWYLIRVSPPAAEHSGGIAVECPVSLGIAYLVNGTNLMDDESSSMAVGPGNLDLPRNTKTKAVWKSLNLSDLMLLMLRLDFQTLLIALSPKVDPEAKATRGQRC